MEPVRAWKTAKIVPYGINPRFHFNGLTFGDYGPESRFTCWCPRTWGDFGRGGGQIPRHEVPVSAVNSAAVGYGCGFYGAKQAAWDSVSPDSVITVLFMLEVEFYGKIIEHQRGYRAEYQRVLSVRPFFRDSDVILLGEGHHSHPWQSAIYSVKKDAGFTGEPLPPGLWDHPESWRENARRAARYIREYGTPISPADIAAGIGTEFVERA